MRLAAAANPVLVAFRSIARACARALPFGPHDPADPNHASSLRRHRHVTERHDIEAAQHTAHHIYCHGTSCELGGCARPRQHTLLILSKNVATAHHHHSVYPTPPASYIRSLQSVRHAPSSLSALTPQWREATIPELHLLPSCCYNENMLVVILAGLTLVSLTAASVQELADPVNCVMNSTLAECSDYEYPVDSAWGDVSSLCSQMDFMPGCSVAAVCRAKSSGEAGATGHCHPMDLLADICHRDTMSGMKGCKKAYNSLCRPESAVEQCRKYSGIKDIPTTSQATTAIREICGSHRMEDCDRCPNIQESPRQCDTLGVLSKMCIQMPDMEQCSQWKAMCTASDETASAYPEFCGSTTGHNPPVMRMYFHAGFADYVLFHGWVPRNSIQYWLTIIVIILLGVLYELLVTTRSIKERQWAAESLGAAQRYISVDGESGQAVYDKFGGRFTFWTGGAAPKFVIGNEMMRALFQFTETTLSYSLMLIAMTFNIGMFIAVPVGLAVGAVAFGRFRGDLPRNSCCT
eukprot:Partr_v1_DN26720_c0_g2_i2_m9086 putative Ctr copper transporter family